ncbi:MAG: Smr/MutS family protein [Treponema sp.]|jgi:DNA mismatch repair protein MutS2|nr:Smr/MutS family protein [Treponema sp.]
MNERTFRLLEYAEIQNRVAGRALSEEAAQAIREEQPRVCAEEAEGLKARVSAILGLMNRGEGEPREPLPAILPILPKLSVEGACLEIEEAYALGIFAERAERLKSWLSKIPGGLPGGTLSGLPDCSALADRVFRLLDREGKLRDLPEFRAIRRRIANLREGLEAAVGRYTGSEEGRRMLQSPLPSQRDGRLVLAVKANFRGRIRGIVHEVSATGQTIFVEPEEVVERNNGILIEQRALDAEIRRALRDLTGDIAVRREDLAALRRGIVELEALRARARYSLETNGAFATAGPSVVLREARHPLLGAAVPIDLVMAPEVRTVIVTGPNTGGKTVALKTLGLLALMNQSGLALPAAEGTSLPVFDGVYADIGDEQSLSQSLSTFSGHMVNIAAIAASATARSLALLDELGSGTDPEEGSAIAMAILDHLIEKGARLVVTTHHGILKNYGYTREGVENASMEFDARTLSPTFRILMGIPGESRALDIAGRNGLPPEIVEKARSYLADERADVSALIRGLRDKHRELDSGRGLVRAEELRLREERRKADLRDLRLRQKEAELKERGLGQLGGFLSESRKTLENLVRELREAEITREKTLKVKEFFAGLEQAAGAFKAELEEEQAEIAAIRRGIAETSASGCAGGSPDGAAGRPQSDAPSRNPPPDLAPGAEVLAGENRGRILRPDRKRPGAWIVQIGSLKLSMSAAELVPVPPGPARSYAASLDLVAAEARPELSLRGMRLDEALEALRRQIDAALMAGLREFAVIHGTGEGVLQKGVHDYLRGENTVADFRFSRPELGGFGRTEVTLK